MSNLERVHVAMSSQMRGDDNEITFRGLSDEEVERLQGMLQGQWWVSGNHANGRLRFSGGWLPAPDPVTDEAMEPFWRRYEPQHPPTPHQQVMLTSKTSWKHSSPHFSIQNLCGYNYSRENYARNACLLETYGFVCLRSRREEDGKYWEIWFLSGLWAARGELQKNLRERDDVEGAISFLCRTVQFGTLDVAVQRAAMPSPD
ncbi:MAG: hypothetical protein AAB460_00935 [Patescibacteria group bacterium]